jgi:hypothetical protein
MQVHQEGREEHEAKNISRKEPKREVFFRDLRALRGWNIALAHCE